MKKKMRITSLLLALLLILSSINLSFAEGFRDTNQHWAKEHINWAVKQGIVKGYDGNRFLPNNAISRAEFLRMVNQSTTAKDIDTSDTQAGFSDLSKEAWYYDEVIKSLKAGYIENDIGQFNANEKITRAEAFTIFAKSKGFEQDGSTLSRFRDLSHITDEQGGYLGACVKEGVIEGYPDATLRPDRTLTRAEVVTLFHKSANKGGKAVSGLFPNNVWSFTNSQDNFHQGYKLNKREIDIFKNMFSETDWSQIDRAMRSPWGGSCFGFTATVDLINKKMIGMDHLNETQPTTLSAIKPEPNPYRPQSLINLYQLTQYANEYTAAREEAQAKGAMVAWEAGFAKQNWEPSTREANEFAARIKGMIDAYKSGGNHVQVAIFWYTGRGSGGHAILAYDYEDMGGGKTKILVYDPNYNYEDGNVHSYMVIDGGQNKILGYDFGFNANQIVGTAIDFFYVSCSNDPTIFFRQNVMSKAEENSLLYDRSLSPANIELDGQNYNTEQKSEDISLSQIPDGPVIYKFKKGFESIKITPEDGTKMDYYLKRDEEGLSVSADMAKSVSFGKNKVELDAPGSKFEVSITTDKKSASFPENKIEIKGGNGGGVNLSLTPNGYKLTGQDLKGAEISTYSDRSASKKRITINNTETEIFIHSDPSGIIPQKDTNHDGIPDAPVDFAVSPFDVDLNPAGGEYRNPFDEGPIDPNKSVGSR